MCRLSARVPHSTDSACLLMPYGFIALCQGRGAYREIVGKFGTAREHEVLVPLNPALHLEPFDERVLVVNDDGSLKPRSTQRHDR